MVTRFSHDRPGTPAQRWLQHAGRAQVPALDLTGLARLVVLAAHPDDESLGAGGLIATAHRRGIEVLLVLLSAGEHSHPNSPTHTPEQLAVRRLDEARAALHELAPGARTVFLAVEDGKVAAAQHTVTTRLVDLVGDGRSTLLAAPWRQDGHPDHDAAGRAASAAARRTGARLVEYPVWWWHWARPEDADWSMLVRLDLDHDAATSRDRAIAAHGSQVEPLSEQPGDEVLLGVGLLEHFGSRVEHYVLEAPVDQTLDDLHHAGADPWGVDSRWYERRKRALTLASLPRDRFRRGLEIGCSRGALSEELAARCDELVAIDEGPQAVASARSRLDELHHVVVDVAQVPRDWPPGVFDLVVLSEVGYFLSPADLDGVIERLHGCLSSDAVLLACHWRHSVEGWVLDGPQVHARLRSLLGPAEQATYTDRDVEISVFCADAEWPEPDA